MVAGKGFAFNYDFVALFGGAIEAGHEQVKVGCQRLHDGHLVRLGAHDCGCFDLRILIYVYPGA